MLLSFMNGLAIDDGEGLCSMVSIEWKLLNLIVRVGRGRVVKFESRHGFPILEWIFFLKSGCWVG